MTSPAANYHDPTPVDPEHVKNLMRDNFPEEALEWVGHSSWTGPIDIPWERVNSSDSEEWAASHQPKAVARFRKKIKKRNGKVKPSILIQGHDGDKADIIDGHHRAIAHHELGRPVRAYIGTPHGAKWVQQALETHASQEHQGPSPKNKSVNTLVLSAEHHPLGEQGLWHTPSKKIPEKQQLPAYFQNIARALMRDHGMSESQAIATAINAVKRWAQGHLGEGRGQVHPEVVAASRAALDEWRKLREEHQ